MERTPPCGSREAIAMWSRIASERSERASAKRNQLKRLEQRREGLQRTPRREREHTGGDPMPIAERISQLNYEIQECEHELEPLARAESQAITELSRHRSLARDWAFYRPHEARNEGTTEESNAEEIEEDDGTRDETDSSPGTDEGDEGQESERCDNSETRAGAEGDQGDRRRATSDEDEHDIRTAEIVQRYKVPAELRDHPAVAYVAGGNPEERILRTLADARHLMRAPHRQGDDEARPSGGTVRSVTLQLERYRVSVDRWDAPDGRRRWRHRWRARDAEGTADAAARSGETAWSENPDESGALTHVATELGRTMRRDDLRAWPHEPALDGLAILRELLAGPAELIIAIARPTGDDDHRSEDERIMSLRAERDRSGTTLLGRTGGRTRLCLELNGTEPQVLAEVAKELNDWLAGAARPIGEGMAFCRDREAKRHFARMEGDEWARTDE